MRRSSIRRNTMIGIAAVVAVLGSLTGTSPLLLGGDQAEARPGRPMSIGHIARRTTRRAVIINAAQPTPPAYVAPAVVAPTAVYATLPTGCTQVRTGGAVRYQCGGAQYEPYFNGTTQVYRQI